MGRRRINDRKIYFYFMKMIRFCESLFPLIRCESSPTPPLAPSLSRKHTLAIPFFWYSPQHRILSRDGQRRIETMREMLQIRGLRMRCNRWSCDNSLACVWDERKRTKMRFTLNWIINERIRNDWTSVIASHVERIFWVRRISSDVIPDSGKKIWVDRKFDLNFVCEWLWTGWWYFRLLHHLNTHFCCEIWNSFGSVSTWWFQDNIACAVRTISDITFHNDTRLTFESNSLPAKWFPF